MPILDHVCLSVYVAVCVCVCLKACLEFICLACCMNAKCLWSILTRNRSFTPQANAAIPQALTWWPITPFLSPASYAWQESDGARKIHKVGTASQNLSTLISEASTFTKTVPLDQEAARPAVRKDLSLSNTTCFWLIHLNGPLPVREVHRAVTILYKLHYKKLLLSKNNMCHVLLNGQSRIV